MSVDSDESPDRPMRPAHAVLYTVLSTVVFFVVGSGADAARPGAAKDLVTLTASHALAYLLVLAGMLRLHSPEVPLGKALGLVRPKLAASIVALFAGAAISPLASRMDELVEKRFPTSAEDAEVLKAILGAESTKQKIALAVCLVVALPFFESLFFAGGLAGALERGATKNRARAALFAMTCFFLSRADLKSVPSLLVFGATLAWLRARSESVWPVVFAHAAFYAVPVVPLVLRGDDGSPYPVKILIGSALLFAAAVTLGEVAFRRESAREGAVEI